MRKLTLSAFYISCMLSTATTLADNSVNDVEQLKTLFTNKTAQGMHMKKNWRYHVYFSGDGKLTRVTENGDVHTGTWRISDDGKHCVHFSNKGSENCRTIVTGEEKGVYFRLKEVGEVKRKIMRLENFVEGNQLPTH